MEKGQLKRKIEEMRNNDIEMFLHSYKGAGPANSFCTYNSNGMFCFFFFF